MKKQRRKVTIVEMLDYDYQYQLDLDYEHEYNCHDEGCDEEGICRCGRIVDPRIRSINISTLSTEMSNSLEISDTIGRYCINRILHAHQLWDADSWDISVCGGYYGQEIESVKIHPAVKKEIAKSVNALLMAKTDEEKMQVCLEAEYGYILDALNGLKFNIKVVPRDSVKAGQQDHYKKLDRKVVASYKDYNLPVAICVKNGPYYRIIDGYHRFAATEKKREVEIIVGE